MPAGRHRAGILSGLFSGFRKSTSYAPRHGYGSPRVRGGLSRVMSDLGSLAVGRTSSARSRFSKHSSKGVIVPRRRNTSDMWGARAGYSQSPARHSSMAKLPTGRR